MPSLPPPTARYHTICNLQPSIIYPEAICNLLPLEWTFSYSYIVRPSLGSCLYVHYRQPKTEFAIYVFVLVHNQRNWNPVKPLLLLVFAPLAGIALRYIRLCKRKSRELLFSGYNRGSFSNSTLSRLPNTFSASLLSLHLARASSAYCWSRSLVLVCLSVSVALSL